MVASVMRLVAKARFRLLGLATIPNIPTARFNALVETLISEGWQPTTEYRGIDAWIDYGCVRLEKSGQALKCEWDNWTEGSIEGPRRVLEGIAAANVGLVVSNDWRWR